MKKLSLCTIIFSILFFQCQGSYKTPEEFLNSRISFEDVKSYYEGFITHTRQQANDLAKLKKAKKFAWLPGVSTILRVAIAKEAKKRGYDGDSQRLMSVGELVLDDTWENRVAKVLLEYSDENLTYLNNAHEQVRTIGQNEDSLNEMLRILHKLHIIKLQERQNFNDTLETKLIENTAIENNQYPMYNHLVAYKQEYEDYPPEVILNMLIPYMYYFHRLIFEKTARWN